MRRVILALLLLGGAAAAQSPSESGTLIAPFLAGAVGAPLTLADQIYMVHAAETALNEQLPGQSFAWRNPENGRSGIATPLSGAPGVACRTLRQVVRIETELLESEDEACRLANGSWRRL